jgi:hypothetical protein
MRFDSIDLIGTFKLRGLTGNPGQAIGLSGSEFTWVDAQGGSIEAIPLVGTNYVICQSVNTGNYSADSVTNGNLLRSAYATASILATASVRTTVFLTPGYYNFDGTSFLLDTNLVDLVGLSSDPTSVILESVGSDFIFTLGANIDTALCNLTTDASTTYYMIDNGGNSGDYLRWDNLIIKGNIFTDDSNGYYSDINGEFTNLTVMDSTYCFYSGYGSDFYGIFDNITLKNCGYSFYNANGGLYGTFSNITMIGNSYDSFYGDGDLVGTFENINFDYVTGAFLSSGNSAGLSGYFRNINLKGLTGSLASGNVLSLVVDNFQIGNISQDAFYGNTSIEGTYSNITLGNSLNLFYGWSGLTVNVRDFKVGNVNSLFASQDGNISGNYEYIKTKDVGNLFYAIGGTLSAVVKDVFVDGSVNYLIRSNGDLYGTYSKIEVNGPITGFSIYSDSGTINGNFHDFKAHNCGYLVVASQSIFGEYRNFEFKNISTQGVVSGWLGSGVNTVIDGVFSNIKFGDCDAVFYSGATISGTFSNIEVGNVSNSFIYSQHGTLGRYENIVCGDIPTGFASLYGELNGYFNKIKYNDSSNGVFFSNNLYGEYKNIESSTNFTMFYVTNEIIGIFENIKVYTVDNLFACVNGNLAGTFSNISCEIGPNTEAFNPSTGNLQGTFENLYFPGSPGIFMSPGTFVTPFKIENLYLKGNISGAFQGSIYDSYIDSRGFGQPSIYLDHTIYPTIERCKFLTDNGISSISSNVIGTPRAYISYTITNRGITNSIINEISGDTFNIENSNIV